MSWRLDKGLLLTVLFFLGLGLVQVYSSSYIHAIESLGDGQYFFRKQLAFTLLSLAILTVTIKVPWVYLEKIGLVLWLVAVVGLVLTLFPQFSIKAGGAHRWVSLPFGQRFEPAELLKYTFPFFMAIFLTRSMKFLGNFKWPLFFIFVIGIFYLLLKQPDFGSFVICLIILVTMGFCFGLPWKYIMGGGLAAIPLFYVFVVNVPYRYARIQSFIDPWADPSDKGFQVIQSMLSYFSGGLWGVGLGQGQGKLFFLPEAHTDFTLAVLAEEMGFIGFSTVLILFGFIIFKGFQIVFKSERPYQRAVAIGVTVAFSLSVMINVGVTLGLLPSKGLSLPFLSYGGSSLVTTCFGLGILLNIDRIIRLDAERKSFSGISIR